MKQKKKTIGDILKEERDKLKMSQIQFAKHINMCSSTYERLENDRNHDMKLSCMNKILRKIDIPLDLFIPAEILNAHFKYLVPKNDNEVKLFFTRELSKLAKKIERNFTKKVKSTI